MAKALFNFIVGMISNFLRLLWLPLDTALGTLFPSMTDKVEVFNNFISSYITPTIGYFANLLPPGVRALVGFWILFQISYYSFVLVYNAVIKIFAVIQKVKFW